MKYVISEEIEYDWLKWANENDLPSWERLLDQIYLMCIGISMKFRHRNDEERSELAHEAFVQTINKIKSGHLTFDDRAPVFNLLTTTIFRHMYSIKNKDTRRRMSHVKLVTKTLSDLKIRQMISSLQFNQAVGSLSIISIQEHKNET